VVTQTTCCLDSAALSLCTRAQGKLRRVFQPLQTQQGIGRGYHVGHPLKEMDALGWIMSLGVKTRQAVSPKQELQPNKLPGG